MSVIRCPQGHYYDDQRFSRCPHCGITSSPGSAQPAPSGKETQEGRTRSLFGWLDRDRTVSFTHRRAPEKGSPQNVSREKPAAMDKASGRAAVEPADDRTVAMSGAGEDARTVAMSGAIEGDRTAAMSGAIEDDRTAAMSGAGADDRTMAMSGAGEDARTVAMSGASDGDHTIALASEPVRGDDQRTISFYSGARGNDYVTGWLVCVKGPEKGRDYRLRHGFNRIGRDMDMDVQVMDDPAVSRKNHCSIVYDDKSRSFSVVPTPGALTYYKEQLLAAASRLEAGDEIRMGESVFVFIPFCGEGRVWEKEEA